MVRGEIVGWPISGNRTAFVKSIVKTTEFIGNRRFRRSFYVSFIDQNGRPLAGIHLPREPWQSFPPSSLIDNYLKGLANEAE